MAPSVKLPRLSKKDSTPSRQVTGTTYTAKPAVPIPGGTYNEVGSQGQAVIRDPVPELANPHQRRLTYKAMTRSDASVKVSLRAGKAPVLGGDYFVEPFSQSDQDLVVNEFVDYNIFHGMTSPFLTTLEDILRMFEEGSRPFELCWELREWAPKKSNSSANLRKYTMLRKLSARPRSQVREYLYDDNGGPNGILYNAIRADKSVEQVTIDIDKLVIFTFDKDGGDLEGESILRSAYRHYFYKDVFYKIDAIQKERHGIGVPDIELPPGYSQRDKETAHTLGQNLRTNEFAYIVRPPGFTVGFAELKGNPANALESAMHHDNMIMKNIMVQFLNLGMDGSGGGRATGATAADMFMKSMKHIANTICDYYNLFVIPKLVAYNFDTNNFPKMKVRSIGETKDLQMWSTAVSNLVNQNAISVDLDTEQWIRDQLDMPRKQGDRPISLEGTSNVKDQYLLRDNPDTPQNEDLAGQAAVDKVAADAAAAKGKSGTVNGGGNIGKSPTSGA